MINPFGWLLGYLWAIATRIHVRLHPDGGSMWLPIWIQPYWARCMGWEVSEEVLESRKKKAAGKESSDVSSL